MTITFRNQTSAPYWTVYTSRQNDGEDISWYRSRENYSNASAFTGVTVNQEYLVYSAGLDVTGVRPDIPGARRISLGTDLDTTVGPPGRRRGAVPDGPLYQQRPRRRR